MAMERFIGVDLSAANIVVSFSTKEEPAAVQVAVNDVSNRATPAAVAFDGHLRLVGDCADCKVTQLPKQVVTSVPAFLGSPESALANHARFGSQWLLAEDGARVGPLRFGGREELALRPVSVLVPLLRKLVSFAAGDSVLAAKEEGGEETAPPVEVAVSVPDSWTAEEVSTLRAAVELLGWKVDATHVLPYSAALATAYAQRMSQKLDDGEEKRAVVFVDIGFSQSTVSVAKFSRPQQPEGEAPAEAATDLAVEAAACQVDATLGVHTLCAALAEHVNKQIEAKGKERAPMASKRGARLLAALQKTVKELSMLREATLGLECFFPDESDLKVDFTRAQFEDIIKEHVRTLKELTTKALTDAGITAESVHSVELVGGGMRIPCVQQLFSDVFADAEPAEAVEEGAAKPLSKRMRFSLDGASAVASGAAHFAAGRRALEPRWTLAEQASPLDEAALADCREVEAFMAEVNAREVARLAKGNELESFIFEAQGWLNGPDRALLKPETTEAFVQETQRWFDDAQYDEATTLDQFEQQLSGLKAKLEEHGEPFFEKRRKAKADKDTFLDAEAEKERQRRKDCGMDDDKDTRKMSKSQHIKLASKNKEEGNTVFKAGNLPDAAARYQRAQQHLNKFYMLDVSPDEKAEADALTVSIQLNLAQVFLKLAATTEKEKGRDAAEEVYKKAKAATEEALKVDEQNVKALFRKATALERLGDLDGARKDVKTALKADPDNADVQRLGDRLEKLRAAQDAKAKKIYGKMFG